MTAIIALFTPEFTIRLISSILIVLIGLIVGLLLRRWLVRRLQKTVLDEWLIQVLGIIIVLPPLLISAAGSSGIATNGLDMLIRIWQQLNTFTNFPYITRNSLLSLLIIVLAIGIARTLSKLIVRGLNGNRLDINLRTLISRISYIIVMLIATFWVLALWQVAIELPVAVLGTLTVAVTFSIQDILKDLVAGLYILLERPFFIGEQISTDVYPGKVVGVDLRATRLRLVSGEEITIPNALVFGGVVINNSRYNERRATMILTMPLTDFVRYQTPEQILNSLKEVSEVLAKPEPNVSVSGIIENKVELTVRFWIITGQLATVTDVVYALRTLLPTADVLVKETAGDI
ncbi:MAG: mechanosensitive ion channel family protein [Ktedonobacteraceae bacterium]